MGDKLDGHAAVRKGDNVADAQLVRAEHVLHDIQPSDRIWGRSMGGRGDGELWDDIKLLGIQQVPWCVGDLQMPDWVEDQSDLCNNIPWK